MNFDSYLMKLLETKRLKPERKKRQPSLKRLLSKKMHCSRRSIHVSDPHFDPISNKDMADFLSFDRTDNAKWKEDIWDCDNFGLQFAAAAQRYFAPRGLNAAVGIIWTNAHAFNWYLNTAMEIYFIEPQDDTITLSFRGRVDLVVI